MVDNRSSGEPAHVLIAGGGFAAVEAALALRALAGDRIRLTLVSPEPTFRYRPVATLEAFEEGTPLSYDLRAIASDLQAGYRKTRLESVAPRGHFVRLASGAHPEYDALILATGARPVAAIAGALTFRDQRELNLVRPLLAELEAGSLRRVVFAVPAGPSWPLPLYELALIAAARTRNRGIRTELSVVTPEQGPLAVFGAQAAGLVARLLDEAGVRFVGETVASAVRREGAVEVQPGDSMAADRVVAVPRLRGRRIPGVPVTRSEFVPTDACGRVEGLDDVYAAGDMTTFPVKQGGVATQQADRVSGTIAAALGLADSETKAPYVLRTRLIGGDEPIALRTELDAWGQPATATLERVGKRQAAGVSKVSARYLTPYLEKLEPVTAGSTAAA